METFYSKEEELEPYFIRNRDIKKTKFKKYKELDEMPLSRAQKECMRDELTPKAGSKQTEKKGKPVGDVVQYKSPKVKNSNPRYPDKSVTGVFQDGRSGEDTESELK